MILIIIIWDICFCQKTKIKTTSTSGVELNPVCVTPGSPHWQLVVCVSDIVVINSDWFLGYFVGNTLWLIAIGYYLYITFLGYNGKSHSHLNTLSLIVLKFTKKKSSIDFLWDVLNRNWYQGDICIFKVFAQETGYWNMTQNTGIIHVDEVGYGRGGTVQKAVILLVGVFIPM